MNIPGLWASEILRKGTRCGKFVPLALVAITASDDCAELIKPPSQQLRNELEIYEPQWQRKTIVQY